MARVLARWLEPPGVFPLAILLELEQFAPCRSQTQHAPPQNTAPGPGHRPGAKLAVALLIALLATAARASAQTRGEPGTPQPDTGPLDARISLSASSVLLGEPVWVTVTVTNRSAEPVEVDWGAPCPDFRLKSIGIRVPDATPDPPPASCGEPGGNCMMPGPATLAPGQAEARRYVLAGDFRITHPGRYAVVVHKEFGWAPAPASPQVSLPRGHAVEPADFTGILEVRPADPARLLAIEQSLAAEAAQPIEKLPMNIPDGLTPEAFTEALRDWSVADRAAQAVAVRHRNELSEGLAEYPAAGMEPTFLAWETYPNRTGYGIRALEKLNTPEAREALAHLAEPVPERVVNGVRQGNERWVAVRALGSMGDRSYLPLIEAYTADPDPEVRRSAIFALGELGGEAALPALDRIARQTASPVERNDAILTLGNSRSASAIPLLIALFDLSDAPTCALMTLTHHQVAADSPAAMKAQWAAWWRTHHDAAGFRVYGPHECAASFSR